MEGASEQKEIVPRQKSSEAKGGVERWKSLARLADQKADCVGRVDLMIEGSVGTREEDLLGGQMPEPQELIGADGDDVDLGKDHAKIVCKLLAHPQRHFHASDNQVQGGGTSNLTVGDGRQQCSAKGCRSLSLGR